MSVLMELQVVKLPDVDSQEWNSSPLQEQQILLTTELSSSPNVNF